MSVARYDGNVLAQTHDAFTTPHAFTGIDVLGSEGSITGVDALSQDPIARIYLQDTGGRREIEVADREDLYRKVYTGFTAAVRGDGRPTVTGEDGSHALVVATAIERAAQTGRTVRLTNWKIQ